MVVADEFEFRNFDIERVLARFLNGNVLSFESKLRVERILNEPRPLRTGISILKKWLLFSCDMMPVIPSRNSATSFVRSMERITWVSEVPTFSFRNAGIVPGNSE